MTTAFVPRVLSPDNCDDLNLVASRLGRGGFRLADGEWEFELSPVAGLPAMPATARCLAFEWGGSRFRLLGDETLFSLIYEHRFAGADTSSLPPALVLAAADLAAREVIERLERLSGRRVKLLGIEAARDATATAGELGFLLRLAGGDLAQDGTDCWLGVDLPGLAMLALLARQQPMPRPPKPAPELPVRVRLEVGETRLRLSQLRELRPHDVIMMDATYCRHEELRLALRPDDRHLLLARVDADALIAETSLETTPMTTHDINLDDEAPVSVEDIEIRLSFDVGEKAMSVGELAAISPGQVIALDVPLARCVFVRANGRLIGRGEIVLIEDAIGVRVMNLASPSVSE